MHPCALRVVFLPVCFVSVCMCGRVCVSQWGDFWCSCVIMLRLVSHNLVPHLEVSLPKNTTKHHYHITEDIKEHIAGEAEGGTGGWMNRLERLLLRHRRGEIPKDVYEDRRRWMFRLGGRDLGIDPIADLES
uniref:Secreted protein n=1 Tax=Lotharella globosa TaxID=91324 RepID=A0A6V3KQW2_9EUKA